MSEAVKNKPENRLTNPDSVSAISASASATSAFRPGTASGPAKPKHKRKQPARPKHIPERTCIACKQMRPKRELIRIVRTPDGRILLDEKGKMSGRGAYLCAKRSCWEPALRKGKLEHEFEMALSPEDRAALEAYIETLPVEAAPAGEPKPKKPRGRSADGAGSASPARPDTK